VADDFTALKPEFGVYDVVNLAARFGKSIRRLPMRPPGGGWSTGRIHMNSLISNEGNDTIFFITIATVAPFAQTN